MLEIMDINNVIARRVRELRDAHGYSLDTLAEHSKVSRSNISLIERGQSSPTATVLDKLATALGVTLASLVEESDTPAAESSPMARAVRGRRERIKCTECYRGYAAKVVLRHRSARQIFVL
ncbi:hypothetical protein R54767_05295 [Paraburkholderia gardini]|uniref:HTH cro/C1-type domain-containing protein n=1 Tax=Paraburkholderia gardini TaxID=2823469 RepID=A0ABM8UBE7_9BURK|nr:hypothetical protein R54767_05295 [Paraburkholderia gardini]